MKRSSKRLQILLAVTLLLYACGYLTQFIGNYAVWQKNGGMPGGTSPPFPSLSPPDCLKGILWFPYNLYCIAGCAATVAAIFLYRKLFSQDALTDSERNFDFSAKGTYGTSGWMQPREIPAVLDMVSDLSQHTGTVLGMLDGKFLCIPEKTRMNGNLAVYGASGSMKTRSFCMNRILQSAVRGESLIICDPKSELYEKSSEYMRDLGYTVRVFNLVSPENSDSWNCLKEIEGQELMAQLFVDVIIKNTNGTGKSDRFWDSGEMNLLKALVLYVDLTYPPEQRTIGEVYNLITQCSESQLDSLFDVLPLTHPAKAPYSLYQRASDSVRSGVISGLGSRLQVFQSDLIKKITAYDEISLELPGQQPCAYYLVTSDQDSTFDFLASLFLSFAFIKLVRYADANCPGGRLPVPVHVLGEELTACGTISELSRRISVIRSRNISMSCVFQNLAGLQNRYPQNQWQEILGNCDVQLFLGCTDQLTAEYVSQRTGIASVAVSSTSKALNTLRVSDYTPQYRESSGVGKRPVLTPDEVLRLPVDEALVILRGHKVLKVHKMDYSLHPAYKQLRECKASAHIPEWRKALPETSEVPPAETSKSSPKAPPKRRGRPAKSKAVVAIDKESIITKPENEKEISHGNAGYVVRTRVRDERGCLRGCDYYVYEYPQTPSSGSGGSAESVPPMLEPLASDSAVLGNPMQLNKEIQNKEKQNTDLILSEGAAVRTKVRDNIELDLLCRNQPESAPVMQEIYELVVETIQLRSPVLRLGNNLFPMALVRERLLQLTSEHIRFVLDGLCNLHTDVKNLKKYLLTMLFNAPVTLNGRTMLDVRKSVGGGSRPMLA